MQEQIVLPNECKPGVAVSLSDDFIVTIHTTRPSYDRHYNDMLRMARRMWASLKNLRHQLTHLKEPLTDNKRHFCRMRYLNIKALQLMLDRNISQWKNCRDEEAIRQQCAERGIVPPLDEWDAEWQAFHDFCRHLQNQREKTRETQKRDAQKLEHIADIRTSKVKALLSTLTLHPGISTEGYERVFVNQRQNGKTSIDGHYIVKLAIDDVPIHIHLPARTVDLTLPLILDALRRINALIPEFHRAFATDTQRHGPLFLTARHPQVLPLGRSVSQVPPLYFITDVEYSRQEARIASSLASTEILAHINSIITQLRYDIQAAGSVDEKGTRNVRMTNIKIGSNSLDI